MGVRVPGIVHMKHMLHQHFRSQKAASMGADVPKGHFAIYVGEMEKRFVVPVAYLKSPLFQSLLNKAEEEYGFDQRHGGLRVPCDEASFTVLASQLSSVL